MELHDNVGHFLSLAKLYLSTLNSLLTTSLEEIRNLSGSLNTECIKEKGLISTLDHLIRQVEKSGKLKIDYFVTGQTLILDDEKEIFLFRIVQEAFNNILKHSYADKILVGLYYRDNTLNLVVQDNGIGFEVNEVLDNTDYKKHLGLKNIICRSKLLNANCEITSVRGEGTKLNLSISYSTL